MRSRKTPTSLLQMLVKVFGYQINFVKLRIDYCQSVILDTELKRQDGKGACPVQGKRLLGMISTAKRFHFEGLMQGVSRIRNHQHHHPEPDGVFEGAK